MALTRERLREWFDEGVKEGRTHLIVVCDTFDYEDYPVYVSKGENVQKVFSEHQGPNMQRVMEVYNLKKPWDKQERKSDGLVWNF